MAKYTASLAASGNVKVCEAHRRHDADIWEATVIATGTFGGGTLTMQASPDNGATMAPIGTISLTAAGAQTFRLGNGDKNADFISVYAVLAGATTPSIAITVFDNN